MQGIYEIIVDYVINTRAVVVVIRDEEVVWCNDYVNELFGRCMVGENAYEYIDPQFRELARLRISRTMAGESPREIEVKYMTVAGGPVYLSTVSRKINYAGENYIIVTGRDVTGMRQTEGVLIDVLMRYLSEREGQFLQGCVRGLSRAEIARAMGSDPEVVKTYPARIKNKLGLDGPGLKALIEYIQMRDFFQ